MRVTDAARPHLEKAEEYLRAAELVSRAGYVNAACSLAVTSGINSKDVICLLSVGRTDKPDRHGSAIVELRRSGPTGSAMASTFERLLSQKTKSQYSAAWIRPADAADAVKRADRLFAAAQELFRASP